MNAHILTLLFMLASSVFVEFKAVNHTGASIPTTSEPNAPDFELESPAHLSPVLVNWTLNAGGKLSVNMSSGLIDFSDSWQFNGVITNNMARGNPIRDMFIWLENTDGTKLANPSPIDQLEVQFGSTWKSCSLVSSSNGVSTFDFPGNEKINGGSNANYRVHTTRFVEPSNYKVCAAFSDQKAGTHFAILGTAQCETLDDGSGNSSYVDALAPCIRSAVVLGAENADLTEDLSKLVIKLVTNELGLVMSDAEVLDHEGVALPGAIATLDATGTVLTVTGLDVPPESLVNVWITLNASYTKETTFKVTSVY